MIFSAAVRLPIALDYRPALLSRAGIGRVTRELARHLAGHDELAIHLFGHSVAAARVQPVIPAAARLHRLPLPGRGLPTLARLGLGAERLAGSARVFHWLDFIQPPVRRARTVLTVHDLAFVREPSWHGKDAATLRERTRLAIERADAVVVPSATTAADLQEFTPTVEPHVIPFGADHVPQCAADHPRGGTPYALCLGTIEPRKNHRTLLQAWRALPGDDAPHLVVVGGVGWECDAIVRDLETAERAGHVTWLRRADDAQVWRLLHHAELLVYPSLWEGFGLPPLEAMRCGVPVVCNDTPALREIAGAAAVLVDATNPEALAAGIETALTDRIGRAAAGHQHAARYRWADCAAQHAALYRELAR